MRIERIILENFRIYSGYNEINFRKNSKKNVYIISGKNGFGKTTLLTSLVWCFYGKRIVEVDDNYRKEVSGFGGYKDYLISCINNDIVKQESSDDKEMSIQIDLLSDGKQQLPFQKISIRRSYNYSKKKESLTVLLDGQANELTKEVGPELFINDFILPLEIAKFYFFDAEKIVDFAEIKSLEEKRKLNLAYSEVLGIKKYETLKKNLNNLRLRHNRNIANVEDKALMDHCLSSIEQLQREIEKGDQQLFSFEQERVEQRIESDKIQEQLIREGTNISVEELARIKDQKLELTIERDNLKAKLKDLLLLAPFAMAGNVMRNTYYQILAESDSKERHNNTLTIFNTLQEVKSDLTKKVSKLELERAKKDLVLRAIHDELSKKTIEASDQHIVKDSPLLDLNKEEVNHFKAIFENLKSAFQIQFSQAVEAYKGNKNDLHSITREITSVETDEQDLVIQELRNKKRGIDDRLEALDSLIGIQSISKGEIRNRIATKQKHLAELTKRLEQSEINNDKVTTTVRLISELNEFLSTYKNFKSNSLAKGILEALTQLMHKKNFISDVKITSDAEILEIILIGKHGKEIKTESLSKGEQQLFATSLLKALVQESQFKFPVFIDSPLQKFDRDHSKNIISKFYPKVADQVVLFPLLGKELTEEEHKQLSPFVCQTFIIKSDDGSSSIDEINEDALFESIKVQNNEFQSNQD